MSEARQLVQKDGWRTRERGVPFSEKAAVISIRQPASTKRGWQPV